MDPDHPEFPTDYLWEWRLDLRLESGVVHQPDSPTVRDRDSLRGVPGPDWYRNYRASLQRKDGR